MLSVVPHPFWLTLASQRAHFFRNILSICLEWLFFLFSIFFFMLLLLSPSVSMCFAFCVFFPPEKKETLTTSKIVYMVSRKRTQTVGLRRGEEPCLYNCRGPLPMLAVTSTSQQTIRHFNKLVTYAECRCCCCCCCHCCFCCFSIFHWLHLPSQPYAMAYDMGVARKSLGVCVKV